jgi:uncharacterized protein YbaR (Trm112 family)
MASDTESLDPEFLRLLCCPETLQPLQPAPPNLVQRLEALRSGGELRDKAGNPVLDPIVEGLVRADGRAFYPVQCGIPVLSPAAAIPCTLPDPQS